MVSVYQSVMPERRLSWSLERNCLYVVEWINEMVMVRQDACQGLGIEASIYNCSSR